MLFEQKTLLIAPNADQLVPIATALHSLIYPFQMCLFIPYVRNDNEEDDINSLNLLNSPINYFIGIISQDKELAHRIINESEFTPPL
jgi:hypothetical protein